MHIHGRLGNITELQHKARGRHHGAHLCVPKRSEYSNPPRLRQNGFQPVQKSSNYFSETCGVRPDNKAGLPTCIMLRAVICL